jgi:hypothetical protein
LEAVHAGFRNAAGWAAGFSNLTTTTTGQNSGMRRLEGARLFPLQTPEVEVQPIQGDDGIYDQFMFQSGNVQRGILEMGAKDSTFVASAEGTILYTEGIYNIYGMGDTITNPANLIFLLTRQAHGKDAASLDATGFENEIVFNTRVQPISDEAREWQKNGKDRHSVSILDSTLNVWGKTCSSVFGTYKRKSQRWASLYRMMLHTFIGDGAITTVTLDYTPATATTSYTKCFNGSTGAAITFTSIVPATKILTFTAAPGSGVPVVILYPVATF